MRGVVERSIALSQVVIAVAAAPASAQTTLYGVNFGGSLYRIDTTTGAATLVGPTGFTRLNASAAGPDGNIYASRSRDVSNLTDTNQLIKIDPATGAGTLVMDFGTTTDIRGLEFGPNGRLYAVRDVSTLDEFVAIDLAALQVNPIGQTGRSDLQGLAATPAGDFFAVGVDPNGGLYRIDPATGAATLVGVGAGMASGGAQSLEWAGGQRAWVARTTLYGIDLATAAVTTVGPMGAADMRGLAAFHSAPPCYANCDGSTTPPILNVNDFVCFQTKYAAGDPGANCDGSTSPPVLNVNDFICFQTAYAAGCP